jgi:mono/diheme cytochrome c family protein
MRLIPLASLILGITLIAIAGCKSIKPPTPLTELNPQQLRGHDVFETRCSQCHYSRRTGPLNGPSLKGIFQQEYLPSGIPANDDRVTEVILQGRNMMPALGNSMSTQNVMDVLAYLHTI